MNEAALQVPPAQAAQAREPAPLAHLHGEAPDAPEWFLRAIDTPHEQGRILVQGALIEWLAWGERGLPGLLLLHGNGAHADWWRFIAPAFAATHRVVAFSWSGMGNSEHRAHYSLDIFVAEILAIAHGTGLLDSGPFAVVGHSFGGFPMMQLAGQANSPFRQAIILDSPFDGQADGRPERMKSRPPRTQVYPTLAAALARFRWEPPQPTANDYICDFIARESIRQVAGGFTWKFDPMMWRDFRVARTFDLLSGARCPVALVWGAESALLTPAVVAAMAARLPAGSPRVSIPHAYHHVMVDQPQALIATLRRLLS